MSHKIFLSILIGIWIGMSIQSIIVNIGWITTSYAEMYYNIIVTIFLIIFSVAYIYQKDKEELKKAVKNG